MGLQHSWRDRIDNRDDFISLENPKTMSFCGDGGGPALWKLAASETSNGGDPSAVTPPSDGIAAGKTSSENSEQSGSTLKEHDYIGMAEVTSAALEKEKVQGNYGTAQELNLKETDLCLGLGLTLMPSQNTEAAEDAENKNTVFAFSQLEGTPKTMSNMNMSTRYAFLEGASPEHRSLQCAWPNVPLRTAIADSTNMAIMASHNQKIDLQSPPMVSSTLQEKMNASRMGYCFQGSRVVMQSSTQKSGLKRGYTETMPDVANFSMNSEGKALSTMAVKGGDADVKSFSKQPQKAFAPLWAPNRPSVTTSWQVGIEQAPTSSFGVDKGGPINRVEKPVVDATAPANGNFGMDDAAQDSYANKAPDSKGSIAGWPPIRSYRKTMLAKPPEMFVKVNMDGVTVGRKVDLNAYSSYEALLSALEEMFQPSNNAQHGPLIAFASCFNDSKDFRLHNGSDYVLTYEDKDGDWMLVGDVPWSMFATTVRRLRITRRLEATKPGLRRSEKVK